MDRKTKDRKPVAVYADSAFSGIAIFDAADDYVENAEFIGDKYGRVVKTKIRYAADGRAYFMKMGRRYYLDNFIRC